MKLTERQREILEHIASGQSVSGREARVADRLEERGLICDGKMTSAFGRCFTYFSLTPAGRTELRP